MTASAACVMLDIGKVLVDLDAARFAESMRRLTGMSEEQLGRIFLQNGLVQDFETGRIDNAEFHRRVCERCGTAIPRAEFEAAWNSILGDKPIVSERLLANLSASAQLWVLSNTNRLHFEFISARFSFLRHFHGFVLSHEVGALKPDSCIFSQALKRARSRADDTLFVDDQIAHVEAARRLGIDAFQFLDPEQFVFELRLRKFL
jgi:HAD superfamily hydrolase (TIGR01509 family)